MTWGGGVIQKMTFDDKVGVQNTPKIDDIISDQPLTSTLKSECQ